MSSIGVICRAAEQIEQLPKNWEPEPLGTRAEVIAAINDCVPVQDNTLSLHITVEDGSAPKAISVSGIWGDRERVVLIALCKRLGAQFYDAEACGFVEL